MPRDTSRRSPGRRRLSRMSLGAVALLAATLAISATASAASVTLYGEASAERIVGVASGGDGDVWAIGETGTLDRVDVKGEVHAVTVTLPSGDDPVAIARGAGTTMWLALEGTTPEIAQVTAAGALEAQTELPAGNQPAALADDGEAMLLSERGSTPQLARYTTVGGLKTLASFSPREPGAIALDGEGDIWLDLQGAEPALARLSPEGTTLQQKTLATGLVPGAIAIGGEGAAWIDQTGTSDAIDRLTTTGELTSFDTGLQPEDTPRGLVAAADGDLFFELADELSPALGEIAPDGTITRLPEGLEGVRGFGPSIVLGADGRLWFAVQEAGGWQLAAASAPEVKGVEPEPEPPSTGKPPVEVAPSAPTAPGLAPGVIFSAAHASCLTPAWTTATVATQWLLDGAPIAGADAATYTPPRSEDGQLLACRQTATGADGLSSTLTSPGRIVHEQPAQPSWPIGPAGQHCSSAVCMQDGTGAGETVASYRDGSQWWASRQVRCVSAPWTSAAGDSPSAAVRAFAEAQSVTLTLQRMTSAGPVTLATASAGSLSAARDLLDGAAGASAFAGTIAAGVGGQPFAAGEAWSTRFPAALGQPNWLAPGGALLLYDVSSAAGAVRSFQLTYTLTAADRGTRLRCLASALDGPSSSPTQASFATREYAVSTSASCEPRRVAASGPQPTLVLDGDAACLSAPAGPGALAPGLQSIASHDGRLALSIVCAVHGGCDGPVSLLGSHGALTATVRARVRAGRSRLLRLALNAAGRRELHRAGHAGLEVRVAVVAAGRPRVLATARLLAV